MELLPTKYRRTDRGKSTHSKNQKMNNLGVKVAYPSFIKDSPSIIVLSFLLAPRSFRRATTATGSVALSSPPNKKDVFQFQSYGKVSCAKLTS
jgi:hypothetical protein